MAKAKDLYRAPRDKEERMQILAERELLTLASLINYFYNNTDEFSFNQKPECALARALEKHKCEKMDKYSLLDLGCGDGYLSLPITGSKIQYRGIDYNDCDIETQNFPIADRSQNIIVAYELIEHLTDPSNLLSEIKRVGKKDAICLISTPNIKKTGFDFYNDPTHVHPYTPKGLRRVLNFYDFKDIHIVDSVRCKSHKYYKGSLSSLRSSLIPFPNTSKYEFLPELLKGKTRGMFAIFKL